eukprot:scpid16385/ scgid31947/ 
MSAASVGYGLSNQVAKDRAMPLPGRVSRFKLSSSLRVFIAVFEKGDFDRVAFAGQARSCPLPSLVCGLPREKLDSTTKIFSMLTKQIRTSERTRLIQLLDHGGARRPQLH